MTSLTHYFKNNNKVASAQNSSEESLESKIAKVESDDITKQKNRKKRKRKVSHSTTENVLSVSNNVISPKNRLKEFPDQLETNCTESVEKKCPKECSSEIFSKRTDKISDSGSDASEGKLIAQSASTTKLNAFEFMMESRNKSIGSNSPGRERNSEADEENSANKEKHTVRKSMLQDWADRKGGLKRKRIEEETAETIKVKLKEREKRFKNMLNTKKATVVVDNSEKPNPKRRSSRIRNDTETEDKSVNIKMFSPETKSTESKITKKETKKSKLNKEDISAEGNKTPWKMKIKLSIDENEIVPIQRRGTRIKKSCIKTQETVNSENKTDSEVICISEQEAKEEGKRHARAKKVKKPVKLAPIFLKTSPKPITTPKENKAKKNFLYSAIPESSRKAKSLETKELEMFPSISHIQQKANESPFWNLDAVDFIFRKPDSPVKITKYFQLNPLPRISTTTTRTTSTTKSLNIRLILKEIKHECPEFPVYKTFRLLREKQSKIKLNSQEENQNEDFTVWTDKYKAENTEELLGNNTAVRELKQWLKSWLDLSGNEVKRKRKNSGCSNSSDEFDLSFGNVQHPSNAVIVSGPVASGKTMAIYAIANELDIDVLEMNASSKRTGKRLLQELQEATQSHQVRKNQSFFETKLDDKKESTKICLLLVEDVDIVFEQDEGFLYSLAQLLYTSKRPIILVTSDLYSQNIMKFTNQCKIIRFKRASNKILSTWLQLVCLAEGLYVSRKAINRLFTYNKRDVRKTLLQLQIWVTSGGENRNISTLTNQTVYSNDSSTVSCTDEEDSRLSWLDTEGTEYIKHENCLNTFLNSHDEALWGHLPQAENKLTLQDITTFLETQSVVNVLNGVLKTEVANSPIKDSLELKEDLQDCKHDYYLAEEIRECILKSAFHMVHKETNETDVVQNFSTYENKRRMSQSQWKCNKSFLEILPLSVKTDKKSMSTDYLPILRHMARSEMGRLAMNNKRGNRFHHYLHGLGIDCNDTMLKAACELFSV